MPILDLQMRARELGRIRIGQVVTTSNGKKRPTKLDRFRITAHSRELVEKIANLYGGDVVDWQPQGGGAAGFEVVTTSTRLPVLVPPQPVSQWYETWSGGGCQRRCDGVREVISDKPCLCGPDPEQRSCKPTTRLNVVLREVEGLGVFRLETHGYYAAVELPSAAELLAASRGYIVGHLGLEERVVKRGGETRRFMVPTLDVDITPVALMSGSGGITPGAIAADTQAALPAAEQRALPAPPAADPPPAAAAPARRRAAAEPPAATDAVVDVDSVRAALEAVTTMDELNALASEARTAGLTQVMVRRARDLSAAPTTPAGDDPDEVWARIVRSAPDGWTSTQLESEFATHTGVNAEDADAATMAAFLQHLGTLR